MPLDKDRKRIIRRRMKTTGESYTTARKHVVARRPQTKRAAATATKASSPDQAAIAGKSDATIKRQTGHAWSDWLRMLEADGAATMNHAEIARLVHDRYGVDGWWAQTVTVGYERLTGRRERGQRMSGAYEASKSRTFAVPVVRLFDAWADDRIRRRWLTDARAAVRTATSPKSLRLQWPDGTIVAVWFTTKGAGKSNVALAHTKLPSRAAMEQAKTEWTVRLDALARTLDAS